MVKVKLSDEALKNINGMSDEELNDVLIYFGIELGDEE